MEGISTYLGAAPIVECLEKYQPNVIVTSRVADAALFLGPMVREMLPLDFCNHITLSIMIAWSCLRSETMT